MHLSITKSPSIKLDFNPCSNPFISCGMVTYISFLLYIVLFPSWLNCTLLTHMQLQHEWHCYTILIYVFPTTIQVLCALNCTYLIYSMNTKIISQSKIYNTLLNKLWPCPIPQQWIGSGGVNPGFVSNHGTTGLCSACCDTI